MADVNVGVVISAEDRASATLRTVSDRLSAMKDNVKSFEPLFEKMALAGAAAFAAVSYGAYKAIEASNESARVQAQLEAVLRSTGMAAGVTSQQALELSSSLMQTTTFGDEAILSAENLLLTFTKIGSDIFPQATQTVLDMSTALGQDLSSSAVQLGKALQDPILGVTALRRVGVNFNETQMEMIKNLVESGDLLEAQTLILKELATEFGGSAAKQATTFDGKMKQLNETIGEANEAIGRALTPAIQSLVVKVKPIIESIANWVDENPKLTATIVAIVAAVSGLTMVLGTLGLVLSALTPAIIAAGAALAAMLGPIGLIASGLAVVASLVSERLNYSYEEAAKQSEALGIQSDELRMRLIALRQPIEADASKLKELGDRAADAGKKIADMQKQIVEATAEHEARRGGIRQSEADAAIEQEKKVTDLRKQYGEEQVKFSEDLKQGMILSDQRKAQDQLDTLYRQLQQEEQALSNFYLRRNDLNTELNEARRRSNLTEFERRMEELKAQEAEENKQFQKTLARLNAQLAALLKEKADALKAEQDYTASLAKENEKRLADYKATLMQSRSLSSGQVFGSFPSFSAPSSPFSLGLNSAASTVRSIQDAIIAPGGNIITTAPDDYLIATKTPGSLGGGRNININISGAVLTQDAARIMGDMILGELRLQMRI